MLYVLLYLSLRFCLLCPHSILCTRTPCSGICTSAPRTVSYSISAALPFQVSHETRYCYLRRYLYQHVYVVRAYFCLYDFYPFPLAQLSLEFFRFLYPFFSVKYFPSVFWRKHYVIFAIPSSYAINYLCRSAHFECPPFALFVQLADRTFYYSKGSSYFCSIDYSLLSNHSPSEWFSLYKYRRGGTQPPSRFIMGRFQDGGGV